MKAALGMRMEEASLRAFTICLDREFGRVLVQRVQVVVLAIETSAVVDID